MNVLLVTSHSIAEYDDLLMFSRMGVDVFSIGAYSDPAHPGDDKRPALPGAPDHPELREAVQRRREVLGATRDGGWLDWAIDPAKASLPDALLDWADAIVVHHYPERWIAGQWERLRGKRVVWRTCGQSNPDLEVLMSRFARDGLQVVRYSPREREVFSAMGAFAGEDAMIRFGKDPADWHGWHGSDAVVGNVTQDMPGRGDACGYGFWEAATDGLPVAPAGPGSERMRGGVGALSYDDMREYLRRVRVYLYTGTRPASYTLGLIEAMMTGTPVLSIGKPDFGPLLEADEMVTWADAPGARDYLRITLANMSIARDLSKAYRAKAIELFGLDAVTAQWRDFLSVGRYTAWAEDRTPYFEAVP